MIKLNKKKLKKAKLDDKDELKLKEIAEQIEKEFITKDDVADIQSAKFTA